MPANSQQRYDNLVKRSPALRESHPGINRAEPTFAADHVPGNSITTARRRGMSNWTGILIAFVFLTGDRGFEFLSLQRRVNSPNLTSSIMARRHLIMVPARDVIVKALVAPELLIEMRAVVRAKA